MKRWLSIVTGLIVAGTCQITWGGVIPYAPHGGLNTFLDTNTDRAWLKLDNFFYQTYNEMSAVATAAGFTVASRDDVQELLGTLPLSGGEWPGYAAVMGRAPNRGLIWGAYAPNVDPLRLGWAFAFSFEPAWNVLDAQFSLDSVPNADKPLSADMNLWAFRSVPEPSSLILICSGAVGVAAVRWFRRRPMTVGDVTTRVSG